jgi:glycosyltransferase involved in cell wall biosynthesis
VKITIVTGFFLPVPPVRGGSTEKIWHRLAEDFVAAGHEVTFVSRSWPGFPDREQRDGVTHLRVRGADHARTLAANLWQDFWWGIRVARVLPPAHVVICNTVTLPAWLKRFKPRTGRVVAVMARTPKGHGRAYANVDLLLSLSPAVSAALARERPALAHRIAAFPYPIDWAMHAGAAGHKEVAHTPLTIGYVGRIHPEKGLSLLLAAAAEMARRTDLPAWRLELVGPWTVPEGGAGESYRDALQREFGAALGTRLLFAGPEFDPEKLAHRYGAMDVFCYPSIAEKGETFGVAIAEAMAARCAPVVSGLACFNELVRDGETGIVFDHTATDASAQLANALAQLLTDADQCRALAARAQQHARAYDYVVSARTVLDHLTRLVAQPTR